MKCSRCGIDKPPEKMTRNRSRKSGFSGYCKSCSAERAKEWQRNNPQKVLEIQRTYTRRNRDKINARRREYSRRSYRENRGAAIQKLGGECAVCGFDDMRALQIDHVNGGGTAERKVRGGQAMLAGIVKGNTEGYQVLCSNCHSIKTFHEKEKKWNYHPE